MFKGIVGKKFRKVDRLDGEDEVELEEICVEEKKKEARGFILTYIPCLELDGLDMTRGCLRWVPLSVRIRDLARPWSMVVIPVYWNVPCLLVLVQSSDRKGHGILLPASKTRDGEAGSRVEATRGHMTFTSGGDTHGMDGVIESW
jgi:hypothetical protein